MFNRASFVQKNKSFFRGSYSSKGLRIKSKSIDFLPGDESL